MKNIFNIIATIIRIAFVLGSCSLGFVFNYLMPTQSSIYALSGKLCLGFCITSVILMALNIIKDQTTDNVFTASLACAGISLLGGVYYNTSSAFTHWFVGAIGTFIVFIEVMLIFGFFSITLFDLVDSIKWNIYKSRNKYSGSYDYYDGDDDTDYLAENDSSSDSNGNDYSYKKTYFKDKFGNKSGEATRYGSSDRMKSYTGISEYTEYKDKDGRYAGNATTYDMGFGITKTIYKDKDGKETDSTSYKW